MADRYWVGTTNTWDASDTTYWSASSGGAGGASVPGSSDNVFFDANSGTGTTTYNPASNQTIAALDFTGYTGTFNGGSGKTLTCGGDVTLVAGMTWGNTNYWNLTLTGKSGGATFTTANLNLDKVTVEFNAKAGDISVVGNIVCASSNLVMKDDFDGGNTISLGSGTHSPSGVTVSNSTVDIDLGSCTINTANFVGNWTVQGNKPTIIGGTSTLNVAKNFTGGGNASSQYNNVTLKTYYGTITVASSNNITAFTIQPSPGGRTVKFTDGTTQTVGSFVSTATSGNVTILTGTSTGGWAINDISGTNSVEYNTISYSTAGGGADWQAYTDNGNTDGGNNSGWLFEPLVGSRSRLMLLGAG